MIIKLHDNNEIKIIVYNARNIILETPEKLAIINEDNNKITNIIFHDDFGISTGDLFPIISDCMTKTVYTVNEIVRVKKGSFRISCETINKTSHWLLPFIGKNEEELGYDTCLINGYIRTNNPIYKKYNDKGFLFLLYRYLNEHDTFLEKLKNHVNCTYSDTLYSRYNHVYIFKIQPEFLEDTQLILEGKYSKISSTAKRRILSFHDLKPDGTTGSILYKNENYMKELQHKLGIRDKIEELESKFEMEQELLL